MKLKWTALVLPVVAAGLVILPTGCSNPSADVQPAQSSAAAAAAPAPASQPEAGSLAELIEAYKLVEVASVSDALEQLYGMQNFMAHDMRPLFKTKFVGPAVTVLLRKEEHKEGSKATQAMLDAIDAAPAGSVYVMAIPGGPDIAGMGGLMGTAMKFRGLAGAVIDAPIRDTPQLQRIQFPVYSRGVAPSTVVNHFRVASVNQKMNCAGAVVNPGDIVSADEDGVVVVPRDKAAEVLKKAQQLDETEHKMYPFIEKFKSLQKAVAEFGRI